MFVQEYITKDYPTFSLQDEIRNAFFAASEFGFTHIIVEENGDFIGMIPRECLVENESGSIEQLKPYLEKFALLEETQIWDTIKLFYTFNTNIIPVISMQEKYLGYVDYTDIFHEFAGYPLFSENGAILTIQTQSLYYSFSEISQIVESNQAKIYGCFISEINDENIHITLKISSENLSSIGETFERYGYTIIQKYYHDEKSELIKDRFAFFQKYLEI